MNMYNLITKTKKGIPLSKEEIYWMVNGYVDNAIPDYQMSAWMMAVCFKSLTETETLHLTHAMMDSGDKLDNSVIGTSVCDKHSTGGVGDKTTIVVAPVAAACGVKMIKMSGRGLGHTGGTIDKFESIPGFRTSLTFEEFVDIVKKTGFTVVSQSGNLVPADKKMYALRDTTATVNSIPLICSSIMSKKLALGADSIVLDVKAGSGAFMKTKEDALALAELMVKIAKGSHKKCRALVTDMNEPLGDCVGNALEIIEATEILKGKKKGRLYDLCIELSAQIIDLDLNTGLDNARKMAEHAVESGRALELFSQTVKLHGGDTGFIDDYTVISNAQRSYDVFSTSEGYISQIDSEKIGMVSLELGAGRKVMGSSIDHSAGVVLCKHIGDHVKCYEKIMTLYTSGDCDLTEISHAAGDAVKYGREKPETTNIVYNIVE